LRQNSQFLLILLLLTIGLRIIHLTADPPADFDWSGGYFADEGYWSHNARNTVLFGSAVQDDWDARIVTPIFARLQAFIFILTGVGLLPVRIIGLLSAAIIAAATFYLLRKYWDTGTAFYFAVVVSLNFPLLVLARQGIPDSFAAALAWAALGLLFIDFAPAAFCAGILLASAFITKYFMIYVLIPVALILLWKPISYKKLIAFSMGASLAIAAWLFLNYIPHKEAIESFNRFYSSQQSQQIWGFVPIIKNILTQPFFLYAVKTPAILFLGNLMIWYVAIRFREMGKMERGVWLWIVTGILFFAVWRYRPLRYYTSLIPPLAVLACYSILYREAVAQSFRYGRFRFLLWLGVAIPTGQIAFVLVDRLQGWHIVPDQLGIRTADAVIFILISITGTILLLRNKTIWIPALLIAGMLLSDGRNYLQWMIMPDHSALEISHDLQKRIPNAVLAGQWAPELVLENRLRAVPVWKDFVNSNHPFQRFGITHLLLWRYPLGDEFVKFSQWYPDDMKKFLPVKQYRIKNSELILYQRLDQKRE
jgi:4-amino-4-deoxy-L-arabinose transferase-like glycosyltransferase